LVASVVTPTRSQNMIVNWRRSTSASLLSQEILGAGAAGESAGCAAGCKRGPHSAQNFAVSEFAVLHWPQITCRRVPQLLQNLLSAGLLAPHSRQFMAISFGSDRFGRPTCALAVARYEYSACRIQRTPCETDRRRWFIAAQVW